METMKAGCSERKSLDISCAQLLECDRWELTSYSSTAPRMALIDGVRVGISYVTFVVVILNTQLHFEVFNESVSE